VPTAQPAAGVGAPVLADADEGPVTVAPGDHAAAERVEGWLRVYATTRDPAVRERIIHAYLGLADRLASRYRGTRSAPFDDVRQAARLGLIEAVDRYDPDRASPFARFAIPTIVGTVKRLLRDGGWRLHVSRVVKELSIRLYAAWDELSQQLGRGPTIAELADHLGVSKDDVLEAVSATHTQAQSSLDQPVGEDGTTALGELLADDRFREEPEDLLILPQLVGQLPDREQRIVLLRFADELSQDEIATRVGISQMHVSRLLRRALARLRAGLVQI